MKLLNIILATCTMIFAATNLAVSYVYDANATLSWTPSGTTGVDLYRYDTNESDITHVVSLPWDTTTFSFGGLTQSTTYTIIVEDEDQNATIEFTTTATWSEMMSECALGKKGAKPTREQLASISSFSCSYSGEQTPLALCDLTGAIKIDMRGNWMKGTIPTCISELTHLEQLYLSGNMMSGHIPTEITTLPLHKLDLSNNRFTRLPDGIENMSELEELHVSFNRLTQKLPPQLGDMWWLEKLYLQGNRLFGEIPGEIGNMWSLQKLRLNENNLRGVIPVSLVDLNLTQPNGLGLHQNCRIELPIDNNETLDVNETSEVWDWLDSKASLYRGFNGMQQTGGKCWTPAMVPITWYLLDDSNATDENLTE